MNIMYYSNFIIPFRNMSFPMMKDVLFCKIFRKNIIILCWKYLIDIRSEAWLNPRWEYINRKLFAVCPLPTPTPSRINKRIFRFIEP